MLVQSVTTITRKFKKKKKKKKKKKIIFSLRTKTVSGISELFTIFRQSRMFQTQDPSSAEYTYLATWFVTSNQNYGKSAIMFVLAIAAAMHTYH